MRPSLHRGSGQLWRAYLEAIVTKGDKGMDFWKGFAVITIPLDLFILFLVWVRLT